MPHGIFSLNFFIKLVNILSMLEWQNKTLAMFLFFHYFAKMPPLAKYGLKIHATSLYHICSRGIL